MVNRSGARLALCALALGTGSRCLSAPPPALSIGKAVPVFTLPDMQGKPRSLAGYRGRNVLLFFYCGCEPCHECAQAWADVQRSGELETTTIASGEKRKSEGNPGKRKTETGGAGSRTPLTVIVYTGAGADVARFVTDTGLDTSRTIVLTDDGDRIAERYQALACPRVFVLDRNGVLRYTNPSPADTKQALSTPSLISRVLTELRRCDQPASPASHSRSQARKGSPHAS